MRRLLTEFPLFALVLAAALHASPENTQVAVFSLDAMPPRFQWHANHGYCGETSLISAGLKYGQYVSQYTVRELVGDSQSDDQVLLGVNDGEASEALHLEYAQWSEHDTFGFLKWIKAFVLEGYPVIIGVYTNHCLFYGLCDKPHTQGDSEYDHIVPVLGIRTTDPLLPYLGTDQIVFSDNGIQGPEDAPSQPPCPPNPDNPYLFTYSFDQFQATRKQANTNEQWYSLSKDTHTYGITILGVRDEEGDTIPVTLETKAAQSCLPSASDQTYVNYEYPSIEEESDERPPPMPLLLTVTVTIPDESQTYNLYRYDALHKIPNSHFNAHAARAAQMLVIPPFSGPTYTATREILSDEVVAYRAVSATAP